MLVLDMHTEMGVQLQALPLHCFKQEVLKVGGILSRTFRETLL